MLRDRICIGLSSCMFAEDKNRTIFNGRPLLYVEESMAQFLMAKGAVVFIIPPVLQGALSYRDVVSKLDALVIHGGVDISPQSYGEEPLNPDWAGNPRRDRYELDLLKAFLDLDRPVLGVCRGAQLINVAFGGSLYQDINSQLEAKLVHRNAEIYEKNRHRISFSPNSLFHKIYPGQKEATVNSVHHQAVKKLGSGLKVEAVSEDGIVESVSLENGPFCLGVQWHPEFRGQDTEQLDSLALLQHFMKVIEDKRHS